MVMNKDKRSEEYILEMKDITVRFPGVLALNKVCLRVRPGTVHALMGENGAGKSTLMKVLIGMYKPQEGSITFKGRKLELNSVNDALINGISMIHQELSPLPDMTVAENIFLGREDVNGLFLNKKKTIERTRVLLKDLNLEEINPVSKMRGLSTARTQLVEIVKAISHDSDLIIMDEPTSAITEREVEHLFRMIDDLKRRGIAIIYITHKMDEVFKIADEITVLRDGEYVDCRPADALDKKKLIELMVGREIGDIFIKGCAKFGEPIMEVRNFSRKGEFKNINFELRSGEILGFAGLVGSGRSEIVMALFGATKADAGELYLQGKKVKINSTHDAIKNGIALLTEDRKLTGLFLSQDVKDNIVIANLNEYVSKGFIHHKKIKNVSNAEVKKFKIRTPTIHQKVQFLSGGNQQKVLVSRWLLTAPRILIVDEPTRGIDVGTKAEIHRLMSEYALAGNAVIMVSSELPEVIGMSDRVLVMHEGEQMTILDRSELTQERILAYAAGETAVN